LKKLSLAAFVATLALAGAAEARGKSCVEVSDVVGYQHCSRYGRAWSLESSFPISAEFSLSRWTLDPRGVTMRGNFGKNQTGTFEYSGDLALSPATLWGGEVRITGAPFPWLYIGGALGGAGGQIALPSVHTLGYDVSATSSGVNAAGLLGGLLVGLRVPASIFSVRVEALLGGRVMLATQDARDVEHGLRTATVSAGRGVIEPHLLFDYWLTPNATLTAWGGFDAAHLQDRVFGVMIGAHGRAFDGAYLW
jgi:hypothetical protein